MINHSYKELKKKIDAAKKRRDISIIVDSMKLNNKALMKLQKEGYNIDFFFYQSGASICRIGWEREVVIISPRFATASYT